jgi:hypothetical protein
VTLVGFLTTAGRSLTALTLLLLFLSEEQVGLLPADDIEVMDETDSRLPNDEAQLASAEDDAELAVDRLDIRCWHL